MLQLQNYASGGVFGGIRAYPSDGLFGAAAAILITCITFTPYLQPVSLVFLNAPTVAIAFTEPSAAIAFTSPVVTLAWLNVVNTLTFTDPPIVEATFYDDHAACPTS